jgi:hypothetical protein
MSCTRRHFSEAANHKDHAAEARAHCGSTNMDIAARERGIHLAASAAEDRSSRVFNLSLKDWKGKTAIRPHAYDHSAGDRNLRSDDNAVDAPLTKHR